MARFTIILAVVFLVLLQDVLVSGWWSRRSRRSSSNNCKYPKPSQGSTHAVNNDYFYGSTKLSSSGRKRQRVSTCSLSHSVILFRGKVYEWGSSKYPWPRMGRSPASCEVTWQFTRKSWSKCTKSDIDQWSNNYKKKYGGYWLTSNNCHVYANRLAALLYKDCK